jgi:hypothetical protein
MAADTAIVPHDVHARDPEARVAYEPALDAYEVGRFRRHDEAPVEQAHVPAAGHGTQSHEPVVLAAIGGELVVVHGERGAIGAPRPPELGLLLEDAAEGPVAYELRPSFRGDRPPEAAFGVELDEHLHERLSAESRGVHPSAGAEPPHRLVRASREEGENSLLRRRRARRLRVSRAPSGRRTLHGRNRQQHCRQDGAGLDPHSARHLEPPLREVPLESSWLAGLHGGVKRRRRRRSPVETAARSFFIRRQTARETTTGRSEVGLGTASPARIEGTVAPQGKALGTPLAIPLAGIGRESGCGRTFGADEAPPG